MSGRNSAEHKGSSLGTTPSRTDVHCRCGWSVQLPGYAELGLEAIDMAVVAATLLDRHRRSV